MSSIILRFVFYGCAGLFMEIVWTGLGSVVKGDKNLRCHTYLWMFPIYGMGIVLEPAHEFIRGFLWVYRGFIWAALIFTIEYITGYILKKSIGECPWDYDRGREGDAASIASVKGIIRLDFLPVWFCVGLLFERMHDFIGMFL